MGNEVKDLIDKWIKKKSSGKITINFLKGGIISCKVEETFRPLKTKSKSFNNIIELHKGLRKHGLKNNSKE